MKTLLLAITLLAVALTSTFAGPIRLNGGLTEISIEKNSEDKIVSVVVRDKHPVSGTEYQTLLLKNSGEYLPLIGNETELIDNDTVIIITTKFDVSSINFNNSLKKDLAIFRGAGENEQLLLRLDRKAIEVLKLPYIKQ